MKLTAVTLFVGISLCFTCLHAQQVKISAGNEPAWVTLQTPDYSNTELDKEATDGKIDIDYEQQTDLSSQSSYYRRAIKLLSDAGVQNGSAVSVTFDPSYETLQFHKIQIIRNRKPINQLDLSKIKIIHQEKDIDRLIYNDKRTAMLFLEGVEKGDIVAYSYTITSFDPLHKKYTDQYNLQFSVPVCQLYYKLIVPKGRNVRYKNSHTNLTPVITSQAEATVYEWKTGNIAPMQLQENVPDWYDPYPLVRLSEYRDWKEVNDWALTLFQTPASLSGPLQAKIESIKRSFNAPEERTQAALRFVQDEIRYLGVEMGENAQKPHHPDQIFRQRFGDCKDKSFLLCTILTNLGIEAHPVLINTTYKKMIADWLPSPDIFDHCTVQALINHNMYWFDPTIDYQRGPIASVFYPDYQMGLVIAPSTSDLTNIPPHVKGKEIVLESFDVPDMSGTAHLTVTTHFFGFYADNERDYFNNTSLADIRKNYQSFYAYNFNKIHSDTVMFSDDEKTGVFTTIEKYTIHEFWGNLNSIQKVSFEPYVITGAIKRPKKETRTMPYALNYPAQYDEEIEVHLPSYWHIKESHDEVKDPHFTFSSSYSIQGKKLLLSYHYENLADHVEPGDMNNYMASQNQMDESMEYELTSNTQGYDAPVANTGESNYNYLYLVLGLCVFITYKVRQQRRS
jgi:transglutaminase-like putative cysteine protease